MLPEITSRLFKVVVVRSSRFGSAKVGLQQTGAALSVTEAFPGTST